MNASSVCDGILRIYQHDDTLQELYLTSTCVDNMEIFVHELTDGKLYDSDNEEFDSVNGYILKGIAEDYQQEDRVWYRRLGNEIAQLPNLRHFIVDRVSLNGRDLEGFWGEITKNDAIHKITIRCTKVDWEAEEALDMVTTPNLKELCFIDCGIGSNIAEMIVDSLESTMTSHISRIVFRWCNFDELQEEQDGEDGDAVGQFVKDLCCLPGVRFVFDECVMSGLQISGRFVCKKRRNAE